MEPEQIRRAVHVQYCILGHYSSWCWSWDLDILSSRQNHLDNQIFCWYRNDALLMGFPPTKHIWLSSVREWAWSCLCFDSSNLAADFFLSVNKTVEAGHHPKITAKFDTVCSTAREFASDQNLQPSAGQHTAAVCAVFYHTVCFRLRNEDVYEQIQRFWMACATKGATFSSVWT